MWLLERLPGTVSERKLRLFSVACCRRIWALLPDGRCRRAVEVAQQYADGTATRAQLVAAARQAFITSGRWELEIEATPPEGHGTASSPALVAYHASLAAGDTAYDGMLRARSL